MSVHDGAVVRYVEHPRYPPDAHRECHQASQPDDFDIGELGPHPGEQLVVHVAVLEGESLGEFERQTLPRRGVVAGSIAAHMFVLLFSECVLRSRRSSSVQSYVAVVDLRDAHSGHLDFGQAERAMVVHGIAK